MDGLTVLNTAVGLMSLVLGGFAIWLSFQFYSKARDAETRTAVTLEAIKAQSEALQKLTGRWMDRFTRHATEPKPADEGLLALVNAMANLPTTILTHLRVYSEPRGGESQEAAIAEIVNGYVCLYHYTALANFGWQALLPASGEVDETDPIQMFLVQTVDSTAKDFAYMAAILEKIDGSRLQPALTSICSTTPSTIFGSTSQIRRRCLQHDRTGISNESGCLTSACSRRRPAG